MIRSVFAYVRSVLGFGKSSDEYNGVIPDDETAPYDPPPSKSPRSEYDSSVPYDPPRSPRNVIEVGNPIASYEVPLSPRNAIEAGNPIALYDPPPSPCSVVEAPAPTPRSVAEEGEIVCHVCDTPPQQARRVFDFSPESVAQSYAVAQPDAREAVAARVCESEEKAPPDDHLRMHTPPAISRNTEVRRAPSLPRKKRGSRDSAAASVSRALMFESM